MTLRGEAKQRDMAYMIFEPGQSKGKYVFRSFRKEEWVVIAILRELPLKSHKEEITERWVLLLQRFYYP